MISYIIQFAISYMIYEYHNLYYTVPGQSDGAGAQAQIASSQRISQGKGPKLACCRPQGGTSSAMDDDDVPLFTEETFRRYEARVAAAKATVQAATGMSQGRRRRRSIVPWNAPTRGELLCFFLSNKSSFNLLGDVFSV